MLANEEEKIRRELYRHKVLNRPQQIIIEPDLSRQCVRKMNTFDRSPSRLMRKAKFGEQDVAVVVKNHQASPDLH